MAYTLVHFETTDQARIPQNLRQILILLLCASYVIKSLFPQKNFLEKFMPEYHLFWKVVFSEYFLILWCFCSRASMELIPKPSPYKVNVSYACCGAILHNTHKLGLILVPLRLDAVNNFLPDDNISSKSVCLKFVSLAE